MNSRCCCRVSSPHRDDATRPISRLRRSGEIVGWIISSAMLILMPKCPVCVAAYLALFTGVGISLATASKLRATLLILSFAALVALALMRLSRVKIERRENHD
jgi:hypothetical protein